MMMMIVITCWAGTRPWRWSRCPPPRWCPPAPPPPPSCPPAPRFADGDTRTWHSISTLIRHKLVTVTPQQSAAPAPWDSATSSASRPRDLPGCVAPARSWRQNIFFPVNENIFFAWRTVTISNILVLGEYENIAVWCLAYHNSHPPRHSRAVVRENRFWSDPRCSACPGWRPPASPKLSPVRRNAAIFVNPS